MDGSERGRMLECRNCRHRSGVGFIDLPESDLDFMSSFKERHESAAANSVLIRQGQRRAKVFTLYSGLAVRFRLLPGTRRQVLRILLPGDLVGLQSLYSSSSFAAVQSITDVTMCSFDPRRWEELLRRPGLAARICEIQAIDRRKTEARLCAVGAAGARANLCHFVADLYFGLRRRRLASRLDFDSPVSIQQLSDALGVTPTHLRRTAAALDQEGVLAIRRRQIVIHDLDRLARIAATTDEWSPDRPLV
jgi:CRP/FNR family transcriptional regulator, anaerobic regulatory protein